MTAVPGRCRGLGLWYTCCACRTCAKYINKIKCCGKALNTGTAIVGYPRVMASFTYHPWVSDDEVESARGFVQVRLH